MNIKNRLKRMESQIIKEDGNFCSCDKEMEMHLIVPDVDNPKGYCETCRGVCSFDADEPCTMCGKSVLSETIVVTPRNEEAAGDYRYEH